MRPRRYFAKLSQVEGVGQVFVGGGSLPAVRVELDPGPLNKYGIGLDRNRHRTANHQRKPAQRDSWPMGPKPWKSNATINCIQPRNTVPLSSRYQNGAQVRLSDLGTVEDSVEDLRAAGSVNGKPAVMLVMFRSPGANIIATVDRVRGMMPQLAAMIPAERRSVGRSRSKSADPRFSPACRAYAHHLGHTRHSGRVRLPAKSARHTHSGHRRSGLAHQHLRGHVSFRLQPR